jgi:hypothetical protein
MPNELKKWLNDCIESAKSKGLSDTKILLVFLEVLGPLVLKAVIEQDRIKRKTCPNRE